MNQIKHPIEPEELMAYLDRELSEEQKAGTRGHLKECNECQSLLGQLQATSQSLKAWEIPQTDSQIPHAIEALLIEHVPAAGAIRIADRTWRDRLRHPRLNLAWAGGLAAVLLVLIGTFRFIGGNADTVFSTVEFSAQKETAPVPASPQAGRQFDRIEQFAKLQKPPTVVGGIAERSSQSSGLDALHSEQGGGGGGGNRPATANALNHSFPLGPMVIRTAQLALITKDFDGAREAVEATLRRHRGYIGELKVGGSTGSGRNLTGTLRIPADQLDATIADLKPLGRVESESQSGQDVTSQYVDLEARLANSRNTEQRLTDLLRNRTGKLSDVLEVEQELDRVRGEIEQMEAERKNMSNQVSYAALNLTVSEDYKAQLQVVPPSTSTRLSNAAVEGYRNITDGALSLVLFLLTSGPTLLVWGIVLFFPARLAWKKFRSSHAN